MIDRSLLITPSFLPKLTGNAVTVDRISRGLYQSGINCLVIDLQSLEESAILALATEFQPQVIHNFHAYKAGLLGMKIKSMFHRPMITTMTGTDINIDIHDPTKLRDIMAVLAASDQITVFNDQARAGLVELGIAAARISVIHQSVSLPKQIPTDYRKELNVAPDVTVFLILGAIRRVKGISLALDVLEEVQAKKNELLLLIAGQPAEADEFELLMQRIRDRQWIKYLGAVPREKIGGLIESSDVLINTSFSESESNAMLEAMYFSRLVIARDIPGNASLLNEDSGLMFSNRQELMGHVLAIMSNRKKLEEKGLRSGELIKKNFGFEREVNSYLSLYRRIE